MSHGQLSYIINDHLGTPKEVVGGDGSLLWSTDHDTWGTLRSRSGKAAAQIETGDYWTEPTSIEGNTAKAYAPDPDTFFCPIRFQGQWEDAETALYYNRARYYDPISIGYFSPDPIGLHGGTHSHGYVPYPTVWIDPDGYMGVYWFAVRQPDGRCYVGKGDTDRYATSQDYRSGGNAGCCVGRHFDMTDAARAAGMDAGPFSLLVEHVFLNPEFADLGFPGAGPVGGDYYNAQVSSRSLWGRATDAQRNAAIGQAQGILDDFGDEMRAMGCLN